MVVIITNYDDFIIHGLAKQVWSYSIAAGEAKALLEGLKPALSLGLFSIECKVDLGILAHAVQQPTQPLP